jgi:hypothetical protein
MGSVCAEMHNGGEEDWWRKPVRPFIWHDVMRGPLAGTYIDYDYWMLQLTTVRDAGASGIVFWGG